VRRSHPFIDLIVSIIIPSVILTKFSGDAALGAPGALIVALLFPLVWAGFELVWHKKYNIVAMIGIFSIFLTGGIGLLKIDAQWLAVKEAAVPGIIGIAVLVSARTRYPFVKTLLYNPALLQIDTIHQKLIENNSLKEFENRLVRATCGLGGTFFFSSAMNYILAKSIVVSPTGSSAFNEELGRLTLLSYPMIAIPSMIMMMGVLYYLWRTVSTLTGLGIEDVFVQKIHR
jgi:hypothetical protein